MPSQVSELSPVIKELKVVVDGAALTRELDKAYNKLRDTAKIKGFRSGKIPRQVLERYFRKDVEADVLGRVINREYWDAIKEHKIEPVAQPEIQTGEFVAGQDFSFSAKVEVRPTIELKKYKGLSATKKIHTVADKDVDEEIERYRLQVSTLSPVTDRDVIEAHDLCTTNFSGTVEGEPFSGGHGSAYVVEPGAGRFIKDIEDAMIGKKVGETFDVETQLAEDFRNKNVAGKTALFKVTVTELKQRNMPALDDEFAKDLDYESLADMKKRVRETLEARAKETTDAELREALMAQLIDENAFDLPPTLVEHQIDMRLYQQMGRMTPEQVRRMGIDVQKLREQFREGAVRTVRGSLLLEAVAKAEKVDATDQDIEAHFEKMAVSSSQPVERVRAAFSGDRREDVKARLKTDKAMDFLLANANISEQPA